MVSLKHQNITSELFSRILPYIWIAESKSSARFWAAILVRSTISWKDLKQNS
jgi:hypothetical protein